MQTNDRLYTQQMTDPYNSQPHNPYPSISYTPSNTPYTPTAPVDAPPPALANMTVVDASAPTCNSCHMKAGTIAERKVGRTQYIWGFVLWPLTLCWLPCCLDSCYDVQYQCAACHQVKSLHKAPCCACC